MRIVVTGGAGFIGSTLVDRLLADGHAVLAIDDLSSGRLDNLADAVGEPLLTTLEGDIASREVQEAMTSYRAEVFMHLAAHMDVRHSVADPIRDARNNVLGTVAVLESARTSGARKVVFASSGGTIYGNQDALPVDESARLDPRSLYAVSKICGEHYLRVYRHLYRLQTTALALGNVYGPRQDPNGEAGVVAIFAGAMLEGRPTYIFGDDQSTRDYVYVDDAVEAFVRAAGPRADGLRLNVGTGQETPVRVLHRLIAAAVPGPDTPLMRPPRQGELHRNALDSTAAHRELGWRAVTTLPDGLASTVDWMRGRAAVAATAQPVAVAATPEPVAAGATPGRAAVPAGQPV